jgi:DNA (cytosine-5)-methyltransferase 1
MYGQTTRWGLYDDKGIAPTLVAAMGEGGGYIPMVKRIGGIFDNEKEKHQAGSIYDKEGIAPTLDAMQGGWRQPSIIEKLPGAYGRDFGSKGKIEKEICSTLQAAMGNGGGNVPLVEDKILINTNTKQGYEEATNGDSVNLAYPESKTRRGRVGKQVSQTITTNDTIGVVNNLRIRKLTPKECWRLMGFSDEEFNKAAQIPLSNTQLYKQAGNSIVVDVLEKIFENLLEEVK